MEEYTKVLKDCLNERRDMCRKVYSIVSTVYRAVTKGRITYDEGLQAIERLGGAN